MWRQNRKYLYLWNYDRQDDNSNDKSGFFDHSQREETYPERLRQGSTTENGSIDVWAPILQFLAVDRCRSHLANLISNSSSSKIPNLGLKFRRYLSEFQRCNYFPFRGHIDISGCRSLLYSLANTILHLHMVLNLRFVVGILTVPHIFSEISVFSFSTAVSDYRSLLESPIYTSCELAMVECRRFAVGTLIVCVIVSEILPFPVSWLPSWIFLDF